MMSYQVGTGGSPCPKKSKVCTRPPSSFKINEPSGFEIKLEQIIWLINFKNVRRVSHIWHIHFAN